MNHSIYSADRTTHLKIVVVALVAVGELHGPLVERGVVHARFGLAAAFGFVIAASLFAGDLTMQQYAGHRLFPFAAPTGGTLLIVSWLALALSGVWPRKV